MSSSELVGRGRDARLETIERRGESRVRGSGLSSGLESGPFPRESLARLAAGAGGHLNHRSIWVVRIIGAEPGLSNKEIGERAGGLGKGHISVLLGRLRRLELIENMEEDPTPYIANAWQLTDRGRELERAIGHESAGREFVDGQASHPIAPPGAGGPLEPGSGMADPRRARIAAAVARVASAEGAQGVSVERIVKAARVSQGTFDELFEDRDGALVASFEYALLQALTRLRSLQAQDGWLEQVRGGLLVLLEFFDERPALGEMLIVHSAELGPLLRARRFEVLARLARALDDEHAPARRYPPPLTAEAVVSGVVGVLSERMSRPGRGPLIDLSNSLMSFIVQPFLGAAAARKELSRPAVSARAVPERKAALGLLHGFSGRAMRHPLAPRVLGVISGEPGLSNIEVAKRAGVADQGHMSRVLSRLKRLGLIQNELDPASPGSNAWCLTDNGEELQRALQYEGLPATQRSASPGGVVSETCPAISRAQVPASRKRSALLERVSRRAIESLLRRTAFAIPLLHYVCRLTHHLLPTAAERALRWLNKRFQASYTISFSSVKPELPTDRKRSYGVCEATTFRDAHVTRWGRRARVKRRDCACPLPLFSPHSICSSTARRLTSQDVEGFSRSLPRERPSAACGARRGRDRRRRAC